MVHNSEDLHAVAHPGIGIVKLRGDRVVADIPSGLVNATQVLQDSSGLEGGGCDGVDGWEAVCL